MTVSEMMRVYLEWMVSAMQAACVAYHQRQKPKHFCHCVLVLESPRKTQKHNAAKHWVEQCFTHIEETEQDQLQWLQPPEGTRPGPRPQSSHPPCALAPGGRPADPPPRLCAHRPDARSGAGLPCSSSWAQRHLWTEHAHQRPPRRLRARARALASRSWRRDLRSGRAPGGSRAAVLAGLPRFGGLSDKPPRPGMFRLERHFPEGSGHARSSASIPFSRASPSLQANRLPGYLPQPNSFEHFSSW
nr:uncharacterized protein LOC123284107 [Equus asinus]